MYVHTYIHTYTPEGLCSQIPLIPSDEFSHPCCSYYMKTSLTCLQWFYIQILICS